MTDNQTKTKIDLEELVGELAEQFAQQLQNGEHPDVEQYARDYPEAAGALRQILPALEVMGVVSTIGDANDHGSQSGNFDRALGDFHIIRELGRGGMGVVYEAEQLSLGRHVALKVLPFASMLDKQQLNRFKNEARAAGTLDHPNIVAVHSVGSDRGVHYYAMQLIEGQSLAEVIAARWQADGSQQRKTNVDDNAPTIDQQASPPSDNSRKESPAAVETHSIAALSTVPASDTQEYFRIVAKLGIQAAEALDHAHQNGIVHRDVKPGNLLIDAEGKLYVTDFGLARIEADAGMTMTGDILGTLRYMSPEQALAKRVVIDHRTDVYSLGATLYELLALQPAYQGSDRQELLKQIAFEDPPKLRSRHSSIPVDLETIVSKAMEKELGDRYATAQEMADDLRRFLADESIQAKRPTLLLIASKWTRRHVGLVATAVAVLALLLVAATITTGLLVQEQGRTKAALDDTHIAQLQAAKQRDRFESERDRALRNLYIADVRLAQEEWDNSQYGSVHRILDAHVPETRELDLRGWEWFYLKSLGARGVSTLEGHASTVPAVAWSPDGTLLASASRDQTIRIWDVVSRKMITRIESERARFVSVAWNPEGSRVAATAWGEQGGVWDARTGEHLLQLPNSKQNYEVSWSPNGRNITICGQATAQAYDAESGNEVWRVNWPGFDWSIAYSPDGKLLATGGSDYGWGEYPRGGKGGGRIRILNAEDGDQVLTISDAHDGAVDRVTWSPDGNLIASVSSDHFLKIWDASNGTLQFSALAHDGLINEVAWSASNSRLATASFNSEIKVWDIRDSLSATSYLGHRGAVTGLAWSPEATLLASSSVDGTIKIWNARRSQQSTSLAVQGGAAWSPDGKELAVCQVGTDVADSLCLNIYAADTGGKETIASIPIDSEASYCSSAAWTADGTEIACAYATDSNVCDRVRVFDRISGRHIRDLKFDDNIRSIAWSPIGRTLAVGFWSGTDPAMEVWDLEEVRKVWSLDKGYISKDKQEITESVSWSPDGKVLTTAHPNHEVRLWADSPWRPVASFNRSPKSRIPWAGGEQMVSWNPDGNAIFAGSGRGWVVKWDVVTAREALSFKAHEEGIMSISVSPDGRRLVTASTDGNVKVWDSLTGELYLTLRGHKAPLISVSWSPDGQRILSRDAHELRIWDASPAMDVRTRDQSSSPSKSKRISWPTETDKKYPTQ